MMSTLNYIFFSHNIFRIVFRWSRALQRSNNRAHTDRRTLPSMLLISNDKNRNQTKMTPDIIIYLRTQHIALLTSSEEKNASLYSSIYQQSSRTKIKATSSSRVPKCALQSFDLRTFDMRIA